MAYSQESGKVKEIRERVPETYTAVIRIVQADFQSTSDVIQPLVRTADVSVRKTH
jgi:hypothetical protein